MPDPALRSRDPGLVLLRGIGRFRHLAELARLVLGDPDADRVARSVVVLGQPVQGLSSEMFQNHLTFELDAVGPELRNGLPSN